MSFDAPVHGTYVRGPTGAITLVAGLALLGVAYASWWLNDPRRWRATRARTAVRVGAALVGVFAGLALVLPLAVAADVERGNRVITEVPRSLFSGGVLTMSLLVAFAFVPAREL